MGWQSALVTVLLDPGLSCTEELLERMARKPTVCESEVRAVGGRGWAGALRGVSWACHLGPQIGWWEFPSWLSGNEPS